MIHKLNNKGMTAIEILVTFVLIAIIVVSMYDGVVDLKTRETVSSYKLSLNTYKNLLTKDIQDDLIKTGLSGVSTGALDGNTGYRVTFTFRDGSQKYLEVKQVFGCNAIDLTEAQEVCTQRGIALDQSDDFSISYGPEGDMTEYKLPDLGHEDIQNYADGDTGTHRIYALRINEVSISTANRVFSLRITFTHPDLGNRYSIDIVSPINMDVTMAIDGGESDSGGSGGGEEEPSTSFMKGSDWWTSEYDKQSVTSIVTKSDLSVPSTAVYSWDVSVAGDGSVMAYLEDDGSGNGTYKVTIGGNGKIIANANSAHLFNYFKNIQVLNISNLDTSNVTDMSFMFRYCEKLTELDLSGFDTSNVTNMRYLFEECRGLTKINLSSFNTSNVTNMSHIFSDCRSLVSLDLNNFDTSNVTEMDYIFNDCRSLVNLNISNFNTSKAVDMSFMFRYCEKLTELDLSHFDTSNVTEMSSMFYNCSSLAKLNLSNFITNNTRFMISMFYGCSNLSVLDMRNADFSNVLASTMFRGANNSITVIVKDAAAKEWIESEFSFDVTGGTVTIAS